MDPDELRQKVAELGPWRHDIDLGPFSTFDVAESVGPNDQIGHPEPRWEYATDYLPEDGSTVIDVGCGAGGVSFRLEEAGYEVTGIDCGQDPRTGAHPLDQARFCKEVLDSDVTFVRGAAPGVLDGMEADVVVAFAILYHMDDVHLDAKRGVIEREFVDACLGAATERVLFETTYRPWLASHIEDAGWTVMTEELPADSGIGCRHWVVAANE